MMKDELNHLLILMSKRIRRCKRAQNKQKTKNHLKESDMIAQAIGLKLTAKKMRVAAKMKLALLKHIFFVQNAKYICALDNIETVSDSFTP